MRWIIRASSWISPKRPQQRRKGLRYTLRVRKEQPSQGELPSSPNPSPCLRRQGAAWQRSGQNKPLATTTVVGAEIERASCSLLFVPSSWSKMGILRITLVAQCHSTGAILASRYLSCGHITCMQNLMNDDNGTKLDGKKKKKKTVGTRA